MNSLKEIIFLIKDKPSLYLGKKSVMSLHAFLGGWFFANSNEINDSHLMDSFQIWIQKRYKVRSSQSWAHILLFYSTDERDALDLFYQEFEAFLNEQNS